MPDPLCGQGEAVIFRTTQKLSSKLRVLRAVMTDSAPAMVEWYGNLITVRRRQFFLFTHAPSLFSSFWVPVAGSTRQHFGQMFRRRAIDALKDYGFLPRDTARVIDDGPDVFAKPADRSVIGSMIDFGKMLRHVAHYEGGLEHLGPRAMNDIANESPMRKIGMESPVAYLRHILDTEGPHDLAVHRPDARVARSGRCPRRYTVIPPVHIHLSAGGPCGTRQNDCGP